ncbi:S41 family peptidase [Flavobacterium aquidurense]|uniref:S41 family peptidase n=1 Tax=Flavobacterium aquidurense TaxID=362413 RepID=UPI0037139771
MNLKTVLTFVFIAVSYTTFAQKCSCEDNFYWLKKNFEENDAGFQYVIDKKGLTEYQNHNNLFSKKVKKIKDLNECRNVLFDWLLFFRPAHLSLAINPDFANKSLSKNTESEKKWEEVTLTEDQLKKNLSNISQPGFEGIWISDSYTIGVVKRNNEYIGYILEAKGRKWKPYQVKFKIKENGDKTYNAVYYLGDYSAQNFSEVKLIGNNFLKIGFVSLKRSFPNTPESNPEIANYIEAITTQKPFLKEISNETVLLRIPSFEHTEKKAIDSILEINKQLILSKQNLIIDVRNNGGGSDGSFQEIIPYLYTNPIRTVGTEYLSTVQNNKRMEEFIADPDWSPEERKWAINGLEKLNANIGKFVSLGGSTVQERKSDVVYPNPKNIGIIINENNASTTEEFLLVAKQSKKVKLFGTTTEGVLDISNMHFVDFPCKDLVLGYSLSKSLRIPGMQIDQKGIQPDFYIDKSIYDYDWVRFTENILKAN